MKRLLMAALTVLCLAAPGRPAGAAMTAGSVAPEFSAQAAQGGDVSQFDLKAALAKGPVVLYFFPKAFTSGCTAEAHDFAEHADEFRKLGATVLAVSGDDIATQVKFSTQECRSKFLVAADPKLAIAKSYHSVLLGLYADRTSYVIAPNGTIAYAYTSLDPDKHVANTLGALRALKP